MLKIDAKGKKKKKKKEKINIFFVILWLILLFQSMCKICGWFFNLDQPRTCCIFMLRYIKI